MTLDTASGTLVPAAKNVIPITESGMFKVLPIDYEMIRTISTLNNSILLITSVFDFDSLFFCCQNVNQSTRNICHTYQQW